MEKQVVCRECGIALSDGNWYLSLKNSGNHICKTCHQKRSSARKKTPKGKERRAHKRLEFKQEVINHYGGKCDCCGIDDIWLLSIDHIDGVATNIGKKLEFLPDIPFIAGSKRMDFLLDLECFATTAIVLWGIMDIAHIRAM